MTPAAAIAVGAVALSTSCPSMTVAISTPPKKPSIFDKLDRLIQRSSSIAIRDDSTLRTSASLKQEVIDYLQEAVIKRESCPLNWWRTNQIRFPGVAGVARDLLEIPANSVPSEHLFSNAGEIITNKRNSLKPEKADKVIALLSRWWWCRANKIRAKLGSIFRRIHEHGNHVNHLISRCLYQLHCMRVHYNISSSSAD